MADQQLVDRQVGQNQVRMKEERRKSEHFCNRYDDEAKMKGERTFTPSCTVRVRMNREEHARREGSANPWNVGYSAEEARRSRGWKGTTQILVA